MSFCGILPSFDHNIQDWKSCKNRILQWFIANEINNTSDPTGMKRRAVLLTTLTDGTYKLAADLALPKELQEVPYDDIISLLDAHFTPKRNGFGERHKFHTATQQPGESHQQWAARLRGLSADCGFSNVEEALRDRFVIGLLIGPERDKLFAQSTESLTLGKAVELADSVRCARAGAGASATSSQPVDQLFNMTQRASRKDSSRPNPENCAVCGRTNHKSAQCRFAKFKCNKCNEKGHLRKMCKNVNHLGVSDLDTGDDGKCFNIRTMRGEPMTECVFIGDICIQFEIDGGSAVTVINEKSYKRYFSNFKVSQSNKQLLSYTGHPMKCIGVIQLPITYMRTTHNLEVYVVRDGGPPLLGRDFLSLFMLQLLPCNFLNSTNSVVNDLQRFQFPQLFSDNLGKFNKYEVKLQLKDNTKPVFFRARPIAFALRDKIDKEIDRLVELGILKPVDHAEYASPIVPVLKRNGSVRLCVDYSCSINKHLIVEQYPLPTIHELFSKLHGGLQFSKLDLSMAYNQFVLDEESQRLTCINTHRGLFKYTRMVFGLASAPAIFQKAIDMVLSGMDGVLCLLDDILITADSTELHLKRLHSVLLRLQNAGLVLQKEKCVFFQNEINYLGYVIDRHGLRKSSDKVKAILDAPAPTDVHKLQSFLGLVNYYRNFVPDASTILSPLYDLLKKETKWSWEKLHNDAFCRIKSILASEQVLAHYNPKEKIILTVDASPYGLGAILSQTCKSGIERPISFASRTLNAAEKRYSQIQKEATAIIFGVRRFHQYLYGRSHPFVLRTDHKPLIAIFGPYRGIPEISANRLQRYAMFLSAYNYTIEYVRSEYNCADFLSRAYLPATGASPQVTPARVNVNSYTAGIEDRASYVNFVIDEKLPITVKVLRDETKKDVVLNKIIQYIVKGWPKKVNNLQIKPFHLCRTQLSYENGCVMRGHKIVIPVGLRHNIFTELHRSHLGIVKTKAEARARFWFPGIDKELEKMIGTCGICNQLRPTPPRAPLAPWPYPPKPFYRIHIDFLGPINNRNYLVIVDAFSKWVEVYDMCNTTTSSATIDKIYDFMSRFGVPHTIVSDNGLAFVSQEFQKFCLSNGISHITSPAYHPVSNGQAESYVKIVKKGIKCSILGTNNVRDSKLMLLKYLFDYRNSIHSVTGCSPSQLVFGHKLRSHLDVMNPIETMSPASTSLTHTVEAKQCLQSKHYGGKNKQHFGAGDQILYKKFKSNNNYYWCRGTILKQLGKVMYLVKDNLSFSHVRKHKNQLVSYKGDIEIGERIHEPDYDVYDNIEKQDENENKGECSLRDHAGEEMDVQQPRDTTIVELGPGEATLSSQASSQSNDNTESDSQPVDLTVSEEPSTLSRHTSRLLRNMPSIDYKRFF